MPYLWLDYKRTGNNSPLSKPLIDQTRQQVGIDLRQPSIHAMPELANNTINVYSEHAGNLMKQALSSPPAQRKFFNKPQTNASWLLRKNLWLNRLSDLVTTEQPSEAVIQDYIQLETQFNRISSNDDLETVQLLKDTLSNVYHVVTSFHNYQQLQQRYEASIVSEHNNLKTKILELQPQNAIPKLKQTNIELANQLTVLTSYSSFDFYQHYLKSMGVHSEAFSLTQIGAEIQPAMELLEAQCTKLPQTLHKLGFSASEIKTVTYLQQQSLRTCQRMLNEEQKMAHASDTFTDTANQRLLRLCQDNSMHNVSNPKHIQHRCVENYNHLISESSRSVLDVSQQTMDLSPELIRLLSQMSSSHIEKVNSHSLPEMLVNAVYLMNRSKHVGVQHTILKSARQHYEQDLKSGQYMNRLDNYIAQYYQYEEKASHEHVFHNHIEKPLTPLSGSELNNMDEHNFAVIFYANKLNMLARYLRCCTLSYAQHATTSDVEVEQYFKHSLGAYYTLTPESSKSPTQHLPKDTIINLRQRSDAAIKNFTMPRDVTVINAAYCVREINITVKRLTAYLNNQFIPTMRAQQVKNPSFVNLTLQLVNTISEATDQQLSSLQRDTLYTWHTNMGMVSAAQHIANINDKNFTAPIAAAPINGPRLIVIR
tara:strand:- start:7883 stop:9838 length:1956 start_codon:yes stop_codon:yes gene_type:complete